MVMNALHQYKVLIIGETEAQKSLIIYYKTESSNILKG